jgi:hypothetical protein
MCKQNGGKQCISDDYFANFSRNFDELKLMMRSFVYFMQEFDGFELRYVEFSIDHGEIGCF